MGRSGGIIIVFLFVSSVQSARYNDAYWAEWSSWSVCEAGGGLPECKGYSSRSRDCMTESYSKWDDDYEYEVVRSFWCEEDDEVGEEFMPCDIVGSVHGGWASWTGWSGCSAVMGDGVYRRERNCTNPMPCRNGLPCFGDGEEESWCRVVPPGMKLYVLDPTYSTAEGAMQIYFGSIVYIKSEASGGNYIFQHEWKLSKDETELDSQQDINEYEFRANALGLYLLGLNVTIYNSTSLYQYDLMYINVEYPPPNAGITGGSGKIVPVGPYITEALTSSYDIVKGIGNTEGLMFQWACIPFKYTETYDIFKLELDASMFFEDRDYNITKSQVVTDIIPQLMSIMNSSVLIQYIISQPPFLSTCCAPLHQRLLNNETLAFTDYNVTFKDTNPCFDQSVPTENSTLISDLYTFKRELNQKDNRAFVRDLYQELDDFSILIRDMIISADFLTISMDAITPILSKVLDEVKFARNTMSEILEWCYSSFKLPNFSTYCKTPEIYAANMYNPKPCFSAIQNGTYTNWSVIYDQLPMLLQEYEYLVKSNQCSNLTTPAYGYTEVLITEDDVTDKLAKLLMLQVSIHSVNSYAQQRVVSTGAAADRIAIVCRQNCMSKFATTSLLSLRAQCPSCVPRELHTLTYNWTVLLLNENTKDIEFYTLTKGYLTAPNSKSFVLSANTLPYISRHKYIIQVQVEFAPFNGTNATFSQCLLTLNPDLPPYGGSCAFNPEISVGIAGLTPFTIECKNWMDEGYRRLRNDRVDWKEVIKYRFIVDTGYNKSWDSLLYFGAERIQTVYMPAGLAAYNHNVHVKIKIYDLFGDHVTHNLYTRVQPALQTSTSMAAVNDFTAQCDNLLSDALSLGNNKMAATVISNTAKSLGNLKLKVPSSELDSIDWSSLSSSSSSSGSLTMDDMWGILDADSSQPKEYDSLKDLTGRYMSVMKSMVEHGDDNSLVTVKHMAHSVKALTGNKAVLNSTTVGDGVTTTYVMLKKFLHSSGSLENPLYEDYESTSDAVLGVIDNSLENLLSPVSKEFPSTTEMFDNIDAMRVKANAAGSEDDEDMTPTEKAFYACGLYEKTLDVTSENRENAQKHVPNVTESIKNLGSVLSSMTYRKQLPVHVNGRMVNTSMQRIKNSDLHKTPLTKEDLNLQFLGNASSDDDDQEESDVQMTLFKNCPYTWDPTTKFLTSKTVGVNAKSKAGQEQKIPLRISLPRTENVTKQSVYLSTPPLNEEGSQTFFYKLYWENYFDDLILVGEGSTDRMSFVVYIRGEIGPTRNDYDWKKQIPASSVTERNYRLVIPGGLFSRSTTTYVGVHVTYGSSHARKKRQVIVNSLSNNGSDIIKHQIYVNSGSCVTWDETSSSWSKKGCAVSPLSTENETICDCDDPPGTIFSSAIFVPPNSIDFSTVFDKFDILNNGAVFGTVIALICLYILLLIWARRQDKQDKIRFSLGYLVDNNERHEYIYLVTAYTGLSPNAGTSSNVFFILASDRRTTGVRYLKDKDVKTFEVGSERTFVMCVRKYLGPLSYLRIWHDNSGKGTSASWFLGKVVVEDVQRNTITTFVCNEWLSLESAESQIQQVLLASEDKELNSFKNSFRERSRESVMDKHTMLSFIFRPSGSQFNRVQRLSCCAAMLFLTMIANAMFYRQNQDGGSQVQIGPLMFSLSGLYISFICVLISAVPVVAMSLLFQKSRQHISRKELDIFSKVPDIVRSTSKKPLEEKIQPIEKKKMLPFPCFVIAWILVCLSIIVPGFFLILYSMEWGKEKSEQWLITFLLSFLQSAFVADPLKIIVLAAVFSLITKTKTDSKSKDVNLNNILATAKDCAKTSDPEVLTKVKPPEPLDKELMAEKRLQCQQRVKAHKILWELMYFLLFLSALYLISYSNRDFNSYFLRQHIENQLLRNPHPASTSFIFPKRFNDIIRAQDYFTWLEESLLPFAFPISDFRGRKPSAYERSFLSDFSNYRLGPIRLRQLRSKPEKCSTTTLNISTCYADYTLSNQLEENFCKGWTKGSCTWKITDMTKEAWSFSSALKVWGTPTVGLEGTYGGGGYLADMAINFDISNTTVNDLKQSKWIDRQTRAILLEFTVINMPSNLFCHLSLLTEFPSTGGVLKTNSISIFRVYQHLGSTGLIIIICEVILLICMMIFTGKFSRNVYKKGRFFLKSGWNKLDLLILILFWVTLIMYFVRLAFTNLTVKEYKKNMYKFVNFSHIALWDLILMVFLSIMVFLVTLRVMRILSYNKRVTMIFSVLIHGAKGLIGCFILFGIVYFAYVGLGYLLFGRQIVDYSNYLRSLTTTVNAFIGKNSIEAMVEVSSALAHAYYFTFVFMIIWILMTMLNATLNQSISVVRKEVEVVGSPYGLQNIAEDVFKDFLTLLQNLRPRNKNLLRSKDTKTNKDKEVNQRKMSFQN